MSDTNGAAAPPPAANTPEARTPTGEIKPPTPATLATDAIAPPPPGDGAEAKPADAAKPAEGAKDDKAKEGAKPAGAPETYEEFKVPEGFTLAPELAKEAGELFKGLNLDQAQAQSLVDFHTAKTADAAKAPMKAWTETQDRWKEEIKADPEIGGKLDQVKSTVAKAIDGLGDAKLAADFKQAMDYTGAGNNPAFIRAFYKLAQKVTEPGHVTGRGPVAVKDPTGAPPSAAKAMFPNLP